MMGIAEFDMIRDLGDQLKDAQLEHQQFCNVIVRLRQDNDRVVASRDRLLVVRHKLENENYKLCNLSSRWRLWQATP